MSALSAQRSAAHRASGNRPCVVHLFSTSEPTVRFDRLGEHPPVFVSLLEPRTHYFVHRNVEVNHLARERMATQSVTW